MAWKCVRTGTWSYPAEREAQDTVTRPRTSGGKR